MHQRRAKTIILICFGIFVGGAADSLSLWRQRVIALDEAVTVQSLCRPYPAARLLCSAQEFTANIDAYLARFAKEVGLDGSHCFVGRHTLPDHFPQVIHAPCAQTFLSANLLQFLEERGIQEELASSEPLPAPGDDVSNQPPTKCMIEQCAAMQLNGTGQPMSETTLGIEEYRGT